MSELSTIQFREAMSCLGAAVNVITSAGPGGQLGFTATAVCSVTDQPPTLMVCMNRKSAQNEPLKLNRVLCVNALANEQQTLSAIFAGMTEAKEDDRFLAASWTRLSTGSPVLSHAVASFDCKIEEAIEIGTHSVFLCSVVDVAVSDRDDPLVYFRRGYHSTRAIS